MAIDRDPDGPISRTINAAARKANGDPDLLDTYFRHWSSCRKKTATCYSCLVFTHTDHFHDTYQEETNPMARAIYGPTPARIYGPTPAPKPPQPPIPGKEFRTATSACPYEDSRVTFIFIPYGTGLASVPGIPTIGRMCKTVVEKRDALLQFQPNLDTLLVAWPGQYSQDIFVIKTNDERDKALARFGIVPQPSVPRKTYTAADGTVYVENAK